MAIGNLKPGHRKYQVLRYAILSRFIVWCISTIAILIIPSYDTSSTISVIPTVLKKRNWDVFDKIYCVVSPWKKDRQAPLMAELEKVGLTENNVKFINGIQDIENGHRGAWQAHKNVAIDAIENNYERVLVFEDDISFTNSFVDTFEYKLYELSEFLNHVQYWEYFYFCYNANAIKRLQNPRFENNFVHLNSWSTVAYAMSIGGMEKLMFSTFPNAEGGTVDGVLHSSKFSYGFFPMVTRHVPNFSFTTNTNRSSNFLLNWESRALLLKEAAETVCRSSLAYCKLAYNGKCVKIKCKISYLRRWGEKYIGDILHF